MQVVSGWAGQDKCEESKETAGVGRHDRGQCRKNVTLRRADQLPGLW